MSAMAVWWARTYHSIMVRVVVLALLGIAVAGSTRAYITLHFLRTSAMVSVTERQLDVAQNVASDIANKVALRQETLQRLTLALPLALVDKPIALREWLHGQFEVLPPFFDGLSVERSDGTVIATYPPMRPTFEAINRGAPEHIQIGNVNGAPALSVTDSLVQKNGHEKGYAKGQAGVLLRGVSQLAVPGFLGTVQSDKNGKTGASMVVFAKERLFFDLSDPAPRLQPLPQAGSSALFDHWATGVQPKGVVVNAQGQEVLAAMFAVPTQTWSVVASMPVAEALIQFDQWVLFFFKTSPFFLVVFMMISGVVSYFILRPLSRSARLADQMSRGETPLVRLPVGRPDEIGALTAAFNRLLDRLDEQSTELTMQKEQAEAATLAKSRFLAAASHDLRQPMHALNLYLGALDRFDLPSAARPVMTSARECAQTMDEMFRALLDISRLDASAMQAHISVFAIAPLLEKIKNGYVQQAHAKGLTLHVVPCSAFVSSDAELLERVLSNLVSNAVRYTEHGKILLGCRRTATGLRVGVYDTGPGIAADQQHAVFEEFYQVGNAERDRAQGLGLGLAIVQRLAKLLHAPLTLRSKPGRGSMFCIEVPRAQPKSAKPPQAVLAVRGQHATLGGALIAVIDDEPLILDATALVLRQWGCTVVTATSGAQAIEQLSLCDRAPDAIVCDHRLRGTETGVDVIAALRVEFNSDIPAVLITGDTSPQRIRSIAETGIPVLNKPLQDHVLMDALLRLLNQLPIT